MKNQVNDPLLLQLPFSSFLFAAFRLLSHLMLTEGLREMFHPEMGGLQVAMYQLTRLLAETHPSLYRFIGLPSVGTERP